MGCTTLHFQTQEDEDGNTVFKLDSEGIEWLKEGLENLSWSQPGTKLSTPSMWTETAPWWRFWNRKPKPVIGELRLIKVADQSD